VFDGECTAEETERGCEPSNWKIDEQYMNQYVPEGFCECMDDPWALGLDGGSTPEEV